MKKTLSKLAALYFIFSIIAINSGAYSFVLANAGVGDYPRVQCVQLTNDLIYGSKDLNTGNEVTLLQSYLIQKGYEIGSDNFGTFGYGTKDAVASLQKSSGLIPTGFVGSNTREAIKNASCNTDYSNLPSTRQISNIPAQTCGTNNGWIWNGTKCVNTCDMAHPWNPNTQRCSTQNDYYYGYNNTPNQNVITSCEGGYYWTGSSCSQNVQKIIPSSNYVSATNNVCAVYGSQFIWNGSLCISSVNQNLNNNYVYSYPSTNVNYINSNPTIYTANNIAITSSNNLNSCAAYAPNFVWNGSFCVQPNNFTYCGNDNNLYWNGTSCAKKYITEYLCNTDGKYYTNPNFCPSVNSGNNNGYVNPYLGNYDGFGDKYNYLGTINYIYTNNCANCSQDNETVESGYYDVYGNYHAF